MNDLFKIMRGVLRAAGDSEEVAEVTAFAAWRRVAGPEMLPNAVPFRLYRKTLIVAVPDATWQRQLENMAPQLVFSLNKVIGQALVTYIEFRIDPETVEAARSPRQEVVDRETFEADALQAIDSELYAAAQAIHDPELRHHFLVAAGTNLKREQ